MSDEGNSKGNGTVSQIHGSRTYYQGQADEKHLNERSDEAAVCSTRDGLVGTGQEIALCRINRGRQGKESGDDKDWRYRLMIRLDHGAVYVELLEGDVLVHVSDPSIVLSFVMSPEKARALSAEIFSAYLETQGLGKLPS